MRDHDGQLLEVTDVTFSYEPDNPDSRGYRALRGMNLSVAPGEYVAVMGRNGSGKSTLAKLIDVLELPTEGDITVFGYNTRDTENFWNIRENCSCVFQNPDNQIVGTTVEEDVAFGPENLGVPLPELRERVTEALTAVGLLDKRLCEAASLSGGQKQKLAIAGALAMHPKVLILDEATAMLDPVSREEFLSLVEKIREELKITIITITHDMDEASRCDRVAVMGKGVVNGYGKPYEVFSDEELIKGANLDRPVHYRFLSEVSRVTGTAIPEGRDINDIMTASKTAAEMILNAGNIRAIEIPPRRTSPEGEPVLEVKDLSYTYEGSGFSIKDMNFTVHKGERLGIVGRSGCGKTTLISHLNALISPQQGEVIIKSGGKVLNTSVKKDIKEIRSKVGLVFQYPEHQLFEETVLKDVSYGLKKMGVPEEEHRERVLKALRLVGLGEHHLEISPFELSGGQKRRCAMAGVLVMDPEVLVLDEPAASLDPKGRREMFELIDHLSSEGKTIILVTHNMDEAAANCDRICALKDGRMVTISSPEELFSDQELTRHLGVDNPRITDFSELVMDELKKALPGLMSPRAQFEPEREADAVCEAVRRYRGENP